LNPSSFVKRAWTMTHGFRLRTLAPTAIVILTVVSPLCAQQGGAAPQPVFRWDDHPSIHLGKGTHIDFRARFQEDIRKSDALLTDEDPTFDIARRRVGVEGEIRNVVEFQVERELVSGDGWRDVFVNYKQFDGVQVQAGKFKLPFSLDENTSATNLDFIYRSRAATLLAPGRDRGVQVHGRVARRVLRYELGVFEHDGRNARTNNPDRVSAGRTIAGRLRAEPFRRSTSLARELSAGLAFTAGDVPEGFPGVRGRTALDAPFFRPEFYVNGHRRRVGVEGQWRPGPFSLKSEYIRVTDERLAQSVEDTALSRLAATGWYASGTWALTGEKKASGLDRPRRPLLRGGAGAIELAARVEKLAFGSEASGEAASSSPRADVILGNADRALTFGASWYLNRWIKVQGNIMRESLDDPAQGPLPSQRTFWSRVLRLQLTI
jgi:phosphate-selective porin OprO/OprP